MFASSAAGITFILVFVAVQLGLAMLGRYVGGLKGHATAGFWLGLSLGLIGTGIVAVLPRSKSSSLSHT
jgi:hypothetical protein